MGKASKWIINFLVGKQEKKINQTNVSISTEHPSTATKPGTPKVKRRWSFGRLAGKEACHRPSKSVDSIDTTILPLPLKAQQNHALTLAVVPRDVDDAAATRIQAAFRSHLARKALHALKGLVKLQALIRGHIVRKQTTATIMQMHALMAIQVRARFKRIQMAEEAQQANKKQLTIQRDHGVHRRRQYEEPSFPTANSPWNYPAASKPKPTRPPFTFQQQDYGDPACYDYTFKPSYMTNTKSSKAKVRSQSEPKQRPEGSTKHKTKHTKSWDATDGPMEDQVLKRSSSQFKPNGHKNHDPWFVKLYKSRRLFEEDKHASTGHSNYNESLAAFEVKI
ncbi:hypothetical protein PRUPE_6G341200 [Prunus persica]|uniref:DUF4005 domain-containing protein n=1 Tax=Prunus persica TaxID=3760 RepID=A0A251P1C1_PRUPE|nr:hypothetical protein PRUPE_6G341200 [Prunus persica]